MALSEAQILRYSRQILLREVGGRGQERLLAQGVRVKAQAEAGLTAAAYLAAGGMTVGAGPEPVAPGAVGFLIAARDVGQPADEVLTRALRDVPGEATGARETALLAEVPARWTGEGPWVALGGEGTRGVIVFRGREGCAGCFEATTRALGAPPPGALGVGLGALGALVLQRLLLGLGPVLGALVWEAPGVLTDGPVRPCERCG